MKISIALCTYNGEKYLSDQLSSYLKQDRLPDELVICDDRSTDHTIEIVEQFAAKAPFPVHLHVNETNLGSTKNFEKAFQLCQGEIIVPSDQDDVWHPDKLKQMESALNHNPHVGLVFTDANVVDTNLNPLGYTLWQSIKLTPPKQRLVSEGKALSVLMKHNVVTGAAMAFRAQYRSLFMPIPTEWVHDGLLLSSP
jgi:glycosyltransferase involved in cell wall biosynthesis